MARRVNKSRTSALRAEAMRRVGVALRRAQTQFGSTKFVWWKSFPLVMVAAMTTVIACGVGLYVLPGGPAASDSEVAHWQAFPAVTVCSAGAVMNVVSFSDSARGDAPKDVIKTMARIPEGRPLVSAFGDQTDWVNQTMYCVTFNSLNQTSLYTQFSERQDIDTATLRFVPTKVPRPLSIPPVQVQPSVVTAGAGWYGPCVSDVFVSVHTAFYTPGVQYTTASIWRPVRYENAVVHVSDAEISAVEFLEGSKATNGTIDDFTSNSQHPEFEPNSGCVRRLDVVWHRDSAWSKLGMSLSDKTLWMGIGISAVINMRAHKGSQRDANGVLPSTMGRR